MTPARIAALEAVAEAARVHKAAWAGDGPAQFARERLHAAVAALDALPAVPEPQTVGETVEVRAAVMMHHGDVFPVSIGEMGAYEGTHIATITARVPIPTIPTIRATAAPAGGE
jgi:hypothetical protein